MTYIDNNTVYSILIKALKDGQEEALRQLFDLYSNDIYRVAYAVLKDSFESEDVVQEVFIKVWNARHRLDETSNIWSFIYVITRRVSLNKLRESRFKKTDPDSITEIDFLASTDSDEGTIRKEILALENEVIKKLPGQQRTAYLLSRVEGLTYKEIAHQMNIAPNTVKNHIIQALRTFKKHFQRFGYFLFLFFLT